MAEAEGIVGQGFVGLVFAAVPTLVVRVARAPIVQLGQEGEVRCVARSQTLLVQQGQDARHALGERMTGTGQVAWLQPASRASTSINRIDTLWERECQVLVRFLGYSRYLSTSSNRTDTLWETE